MARPRSPGRDKARQLWLESGKSRLLKSIAEELQVSEEQVRKWKNQDKWDKVTLPNENSNITKQKGAQPGNKNAAGHGAPKKNSNAEKHGLFRKYLPEETFSIIEEMPDSPLEIVWHEIQIQYAAIIRSQQIMYVRDKEDKTIEKVEEKKGNVLGESWEVQQAWDKQANFLKAQSTAISTLKNTVKDYLELEGATKTDAKEQAKNWKEAVIEIAKRRKEKADGRADERD
jgi:uncharacterized protein YjcR